MEIYAYAYAPSEFFFKNNNNEKNSCDQYYSSLFPKFRNELLLQDKRMSCVGLS